MKKLVLFATLVLAMGAFVAACGSSDSDSDGASVEVTDAWVRATTPTQTSGAAYMTINSADGDVLLKAEVPASVAGEAQLHETTEDGQPTADEESMDTEGGSESMESDASTMEGSAMMGMKQVDQIDITAGETVTLEPGGYHIMLMDLKGQIKAGDTIPVTLTFEKAGTIEVDATAKDE